MERDGKRVWASRGTGTISQTCLLDMAHLNGNWLTGKGIGRGGTNEVKPNVALGFTADVNRKKNSYY